MTTSKVLYSFSGALTSLDPETGAFDKDAFSKTVMPIRGRIMSFDGLTGCFIARYAVEVSYIEEIVDLEVLDAHIKSVFEWVESQDEFFPLIKEKESVSVTRDGATKGKTKKRSRRQKEAR